MKLQGILHKIQSLKEYSLVRGGLREGSAISACLPDSARPSFIAALAADLGLPVLLVAPSPEEARKRIEQLRGWCAAETSVLPFPEPDGLPFERILPDPSTTHDRIKVLFRLSSRGGETTGGLIVVASPSALLSRTPDYETFKEAIYRLRRGMRLSPLSLLEKLQRLGYSREETTELPGNMSHRGGIIDVFPAYLENPVRIDFIGDEIESLRFFNPISQRSMQEIEELWLSPARELLPQLHFIPSPSEGVEAALCGRLGQVFLTPPSEGKGQSNPPFLPPSSMDQDDLHFHSSPSTGESQSHLQLLPSPSTGEGQGEGDKRLFQHPQDILSLLDMSKCSEETAGLFKEELSLLLEGVYRPGLEYYSPLFNNGNILDFLPPGSLLVMEEPQTIYHLQEKLEQETQELRECRVQRGELPLNFPSTFLSAEEMRGRADKYRPALSLQALPQSCVISLPFKPAPSLLWSLPSGFRESASGGPLAPDQSISAALPAEGKSVVIISPQAKRIAELLEEKDVLAQVREEIMEPPQPGNLYLVQGLADEGWSLSLDGAESMVLFTDREIFGAVKQRRLMKRHRAGLKLFLPSLQPGDYVVHVDHGLARFSKILRKTVGDVEREYLELEYESGDKLYVPVNQVDRVSRYVGASAEPPKLTRLGAREWHRTKRQAKEAALAIAAELLEIYAARELAPGFPFSTDTPWQREMEDSFIYEETPDQMKAVEEVKLDMERPRPMDRLICGDVGYGKTEVAVRAAFKAVMDGKQAAVLVPTTILAQQHYFTFKERLKAFPVRVEVLSRFKSPREQKEIVQGLQDGSVDICIGTHRLLQKDISFKDLGLVVIDEEQRFGVIHKEKLKKLRREVDVLTLSATPIPRTLHLALVGLRDSSIMETPPEERLPIKTFVAEFDERLVREAILRELEREGQVFFLHNRVKSIPRIASRIQALVPEAKIMAAHGQMPEEELEEAMLEFSSGKSDVLVCSTIIESGLDLPRANTLLVNDADKLGLTQLYHLRGRIGRGNIQAYAYFLYQRAKTLSVNAGKRLQTIYEATELGSGFRIAMADLEIRGAGNILGKEQSGQIDAVGFDLYTQMLSDAVAELREGKGLAGVEEKALQEQREAPKPPEVSIDLPFPFFIPRDYISEEKARLEIYMRLSRIKDLDALRDMGEEIKDRFGSLPQPLSYLLQGIKLKILAGKAEVTSMSLEDHTIVLRSEKDFKQLANLAELDRKYGDIMNVGSHQLRLNISSARDGWLKVLEEILVLIK